MDLQYTTQIILFLNSLNQDWNFWIVEVLHMMAKAKKMLSSHVRTSFPFCFVKQWCMKFFSLYSYTQIKYKNNLMFKLHCSKQWTTKETNNRMSLLLQINVESKKLDLVQTTYKLVKKLIIVLIAATACFSIWKAKRRH